MLKNLFFLLAGFVLYSCGNVDEIAKTQEDPRPWSFEEIEAAVLEEFPEAYNQFLEIRYTRDVDRIIPRDVTFLIPTRYFDEGKLNQQICDKRTDNVIRKIGREPGYCESFTIGKSQEYAWHAWDDKTVTKVTIDFAIGC